jgi:hypothetical protein
MLVRSKLTPWGGLEVHKNTVTGILPYEAYLLREGHSKVRIGHGDTCDEAITDATKALSRWDNMGDARLDDRGTFYRKRCEHYRLQGESDIEASVMADDDTEMAFGEPDYPPSNDDPDDYYPDYDRDW